MATTSPAARVEHTVLMPSDDHRDAIPVGSPAWYAWLTGSTSFTFRSSYGTFTAHKERRSPSQEYWKAYRRRGGQLRRAYLGKSSELSLERLNTVAAELAGGRQPDAPLEQKALPGEPAGAGDQSSAARTGLWKSPAPANDYKPPETPSAGSAAAAATDDARPLHLLATKLTIPAAHIRMVPRPGLVARLDAAIAQGQKLILLAAPAGFGKTTAVVEWLTARASRQDAPPTAASTRSAQVAWLALDDADNQISQFLAYLIAALETVHPRIGAAAWALLRAQVTRPPIQSILTTLVNALASPADRILLVLDDYHTVALQTIHEIVAFLLDRMPANMHIVITTRADPPLPLARLRARGQLAELRASDLRFTRDEASFLLRRVYNIPLSPEAVATLETYTEGWATGLQLAAISLQQQDPANIPAFLADFTGSHAFVFDYLADEVFRGEPAHVRDFLIKTSMLGRLCGPLCTAVTGHNDAQALLEGLDQASLFLIRLDNNRRWFRYHHLFRDFLREHLDRTHEADARAQLYRSASDWFEQQGLASEAIDHALQGAFWADAIRCLTPLLAIERFYDYYLDWPRWAAALPDAALRADPTICLRLAWVLVVTGHVEAAERLLSTAEAAWLAAGDMAQVGAAQSRRAFALGLTGDFKRAVVAAQQALSMLPEHAAESRGIALYILAFDRLSQGQVAEAADQMAAAHAALKDSAESFVKLGTRFGLALVYQSQGRLRYAASMYQDIIRSAAGATHQEVPAAYFYLGMIYYEWNDLAAAEQVMRQGLVIGERTGRGRYWPNAHSTLARILWARGEHAQAIHMAQQALESDQLPTSRLAGEAEAQRAWLWIAQGNLAAATRWLTARGISPDITAPYDRLPEYLMLARIRIAEARQASASAELPVVFDMLEQLRQLSAAETRTPDQITALALLALLHAARHAGQQALECLASALALAQPEGNIRTFVDEGAPMRELLAALQAQSVAGTPAAALAEYIDRLLAAFSPDPAGSAGSVPSPLSEREHAVLQLIAEGRSVQQIATALVISAHTARTHVKNIYHKLEAHNRVQVLERARALQLL